MTVTNLLGGLEVRPNIGHYLEQRRADPDFVMIEFGHDLIPVAFQQPFEFNGRRAYIGIETWLREPLKDEAISNLYSSRLDQNIFFIAHDLGGRVKWDDQKEGSWYEGQYATATVLPDLAAKEVFASNVFGDPHIADYPDRTSALLHELARLVSLQGQIVLRETVSPEKVRYLDEHLWQTVGLALDRVATPEDIQLWRALEDVFDGERRGELCPEPGSYYMFLSKIPVARRILALL